jgi:hypothetical protein
MNDSPDILDAEKLYAVFVKEAFEAAFNPVNLPAPVNRADDDGADDRIEPGTVPASGDDSDPFWPSARLPMSIHALSLEPKAIRFQTTLRPSTTFN